MLKQVSYIVTNWLRSFDNNPNSGFSARKLSAFISVMIAFYITIHYCSTDVLVEVIYVWLLFALLCLGIITIEQIIKLKSGNTTTITTESEQTKTQIEKREVKNESGE